MKNKTTFISMSQTTLTLPVINLSVFLLPEGVTRLRIFEPRYLKMVKIATKEQGFMIVFNKNETTAPTTEWGSWVEIINFDQGDDGILEIDVKCKSLVKILSSHHTADNLRFSEVIPVTHWSQGNSELPTQALSESLEILFKHNTALDKLYADKNIANANWTIARWLELLPVNLMIKNTFIYEHSFDEAKQFVEAIIFNNDEKKI